MKTLKFSCPFCKNYHLAVEVNDTVNLAEFYATLNMDRKMFSHYRKCPEAHSKAALV